MKADDHYLKKELYSLIKKDSSVFDFLQEGSLDGLWYWDLENQENEWMSPRLWTVLGYDPQEKKHLASEWQDLIFAEDLQVAINNFNKHCSDPQHPYDQIVRYRHNDGSTVWVRCRGIAIRDETGKPIRMLGAHTDLTTLKGVEEELIQERDFSQSLIITAQTIILVLNPDGTIQSFNPYMEEICGYKLEEVKGKDWFETFLPNQDWERIRKIFMGAVGDIQTKGNVNPIVTKDGREIFIEWYDKTLKGSDGNIVGLLAVGQDITERNKEEIIKEALIEKLQKALSEIKTLRGIIPICSHCKKIRDDKGYYQQVETYVSQHTEAQFSHGVCPECQRKHYPDYFDRKKK